MKSSLVRWDDPRDRPRPRRESGANRRRPAPPDDNVFLSLSPDRARVLLFIAARTSSFTMLTVVALVLVTLWAAGSSMTGASGGIAAGWLAVHQVPLVIGKTSLSLLPLIPTAVMMWLVARDCARAVEPDATRADLGWIVGAALAGPLLITAVCLAVAEDASAVVALQPPATLTAFGWVGGLHLIAAVAGIAARRNPLRDYLAEYLPGWVAPGARAAGRALLRLVLAAAVLILISFLAHWSQIGDTYAAAGNAVGAIGLTLLSLAYLPNAAIDVSGLLAGAQIHIGEGALSLFSVAGAPVPALPITAAVPSGPAAGWWPVLLVVPAAVGVLTGLDCARTSYDEIRAPWATLAAAGFAALATAVSGGLAGGAAGSFGHLGPVLWQSVLLVFAWVAVTGYLGLAVARRFLPAIGPAAFAHEYAAATDDAGGYGYEAADEAGRYGDEYLGDPYGDNEYGAYEYGAYEFGIDDYRDTDYRGGEYGEDAPRDGGAYHGTGRYDEPRVEYGGDAEVVEGELVEEQGALAADSARDRADANADIVEAEVVEADLPEGGGTGGR